MKPVALFRIADPPGLIRQHRPACHIRRSWRIAAMGLAVVALVACVVGNPPWVAPSVRVLYRADGAGRAGIRFLVAREGNEIAVTRGPGSSAPAYERRSGWVFFASREGGAWDLYRVRLSGEELTPLTRTPDVNERWPTPSPDGRFLFFTSDASGADQIYRSNLEGGEATPVSRGSTPHSRAAVDSSGTVVVALEGSGDTARLVRIDVESGAAAPIEGGAGLPPVGGLSLRSDGRIVYECRGPAGPDVCSLSQGDRARRLTDEAAEDRDPAWSPDGVWIAFSSNRTDANFELYLMRPDGSEVRRITKERGADGEPFWVP